MAGHKAEANSLRCGQLLRLNDVYKVKRSTCSPPDIQQTSTSVFFSLAINLKISWIVYHTVCSRANHYADGKPANRSPTWALDFATNVSAVS